QNSELLPVLIKGKRNQYSLSLNAVRQRIQLVLSKDETRVLGIAIHLAWIDQAHRLGHTPSLAQIRDDNLYRFPTVLCESSHISLRHNPLRTPALQQRLDLCAVGIRNDEACFSLIYQFQQGRQSIHIFCSKSIWIVLSKDTPICHCIGRIEINKIIPR